MSLFTLCSNVRIDTALNKYIWSMGIRNVPKRVRVRLERRRDEDEDAKEKVTCLSVSPPNDSDFSHILLLWFDIVIHTCEAHPGV